MMTQPESPDCRVAVLDDDVQFIRMVERVLSTENIGVQPVTTIDLDEAVDVITATGCGIALIDVMMYGHAAGFELVTKLRRDARTAALPILVTSGEHRELGRRDGFLREHGCGVLAKPFSAEDLISRLETVRDPRAMDAAPAPIERGARILPFVHPRAQYSRSPLRADT